MPVAGVAEADDWGMEEGPRSPCAVRKTGHSPPPPGRNITIKRSRRDCGGTQTGNSPLPARSYRAYVLLCHDDVVKPDAAHMAGRCLCDV